MVAARGLVVVVIVAHEGGRVCRQGINDAAGALRAAVAVVEGALGAELLAQALAGFGAVIGVEVAAGGDAAHVVHGGGDGGLDARVDGGGVNGHAAPAADADDGDALRVDVRVGAQVVDGGAEVFGVDVGGGDVARLAAALAGEGGIKGDAEVAAGGHGLGVEARALLFDGAEGAADGDGRQGCRSAFRAVEVRDDGVAEAGAEADFAVFNARVGREGFVPVGGARGGGVGR